MARTASSLSWKGSPLHNLQTAAEQAEIPADQRERRLARLTKFSGFGCAIAVVAETAAPAAIAILVRVFICTPDVVGVGCKSGLEQGRPVDGDRHGGNRD